MSMTRKWSLLAMVLIAGILAGSWFLLVAPKRSEASDVRGKATQQQGNNDALLVSLNQLKAQSLDLPKQKAQLAVLGKQIPDNPALPTLIRDLTAAGKKVGVEVVSMRPGMPVAAAVLTPVVVTATPGTAASGTDATKTEGAKDAAATAPAAAAPTAAPLYQLPLSVDVAGSYFEIEQFVNRLEGMQRTLLITAFTLTPRTGGTTGGTTATAKGDLTLSITGQVFLSPLLASTTSTPAAAPATASTQ